MESTLPDLGDVVTGVANAAGGAFIDAITTAVPVVVPVLAILWAIRFVLRKIGLN